ncbi:hypothetical protein O1611_g1675 [Lasiodiplodia mahajangana]|uniref:Uncharacterized protein n=1 Tax=Lasiodiplodia mahajangana TaxID=1108764 RepID=A0ACC2JWP1_9PEZI|nr:hypothetical protein O1611_g1675 [Lasiodiplodia mahajangana]
MGDQFDKLTVYTSEAARASAGAQLRELASSGWKPFGHGSTLDGASLVEKSKHEPVAFNLIQKLLNTCIDSLRSLIRAIRSTDEASRDALMLTRAAETLALWGDRHQVFNGTLDKTLSKSKKIRRMTVLSLISIALSIRPDLRHTLLGETKLKSDSVARDGEVLPRLPLLLYMLYGLDHDNGFEVDIEVDVEEEGDSSNEEDDSNSSGGEYDDLKQCLEELDSYIRCLVDLDSVLLNPVLDPEAIERTKPEPEPEPQPQQSTSLDKHHQFYLRIKDMFNDVSEDIANHLGRASFRRYQQLSEMREKAAHERERELDGEELVQNPLDVQAVVKSSRTSNLETETLHDSGLGASIRTKSVYAESALSSNVSAMGDGKHSTFPSLTKEAKAGIPFDCGACGRSIVVTKSRLWKRHLIEDLKPYLAWIHHMERNHASSELVAEFTCPFCFETTDGETHGILSHVSKHLEVISTISLSRNDPHDEMASDDDSVSNTTAEGITAESMRFVCPFVANDPTGNHNHTCSIPWFNVDGVKEHLYRAHSTPHHQCARCLKAFKNDNALRRHYTGCPKPIQVARPSYQMTRDQETTLRQRKRGHKSLTEEEKWRQMYAVLFPEAQRSPYPFIEGYLDLY